MAVYNILNSAFMTITSLQANISVFFSIYLFNNNLYNTIWSGSFHDSDISFRNSFQKLGSHCMLTKAILTKVYASSKSQQGSRHVVKRKSDVDDVIRCSSTHLKEGHTHNGFQMTYACSLGETWNSTAMVTEEIVHILLCIYRSSYSNLN